MKTIREGSLLWQPTDQVRADANLTAYMRWLAETRGYAFHDYQSLWEWSVTDLPAFWYSLWDYFEVTASAQPSAILSERKMPGARWFEGAHLNYAENFFARRWDDRPAILYKSEEQPLVRISWEEIQAQTTRLAAYLRSLGVGPGDRVVAYLPHIPETVVALFAVTSLGAIWSSCSPDFGSQSVLDRFQQIEPKVLLAVDGYTYGGKPFDRRPVVTDLQRGLPTVEKTVLVPQLGDQGKGLRKTVSWKDALADVPDEPLQFAQVPFDHPLWVLYSSGTTGRPKPIVHGHGGILLEHLKAAVFNLDLKSTDRFFWYTSTGWMMWNYLVGGLLAGAIMVDYNGSPAYPDMDALWQLAEDAGITYFGTSAAFVGACMKAGIKPNQAHDLGRIRALGSTGSPLTVENFAWIYANTNPHLALESLSGGTDLCTAFVGGCRLLPVHAGEIQCASLGAKVQAFDGAGQPVIDEVGELVITEPMPSMPLRFWNDPGDARYLSSYFDMYPGVWRHGDWIKITPRGSCVIYGRSDATIKRHGVRMGTSEIYRALDQLPEVLDSLVIDLEFLGRESYMALFVVLREEDVLDEGLKQRINQRLREEISPRHVPNDIFTISEVPYTLSGKKMEVPVRRILLGHPVEQVANPGAMRNPEAIQTFAEMAEKFSG